MIDANSIPELDRAGLRQFGIVTGSIVAGLFGILFPWILERSWPLWPWILFGALGGLALLAPLALGPVYRNWMKFGLLASRITTPIVLGIVFYLVLFPMGLFKKLFGNDSMARSFDPIASSYRVKSRQQIPGTLERPF